MNLNVESFIHFKLLSKDPLITYSSINLESIPLFSIFETYPDLFKNKKGLHLLGPIWSMEKNNLAFFQKIFNEMRKKYPEHQFVMVAATEMEAFRLSQHHIENIFCNHSIFQNDTAWAPTHENIEKLPSSDSIYLARLAPFKRHELCAQLKQPLFVYSVHEKIKLKNEYSHVKSLCPDAIFVNHLLNNGEPKLLDEETLPKVMSHAKVSLCLSKIEGTMRSSIQTLLCGLPIVTTECIGGRERYYSDDVALYVEDTPEAVQTGVKEMIQRNLKRQDVRNRVLRDLQFDRKNFIHTFNKIIQCHFKIDRFKLSFEDFIGIKFRRKKIEKIIQSLDS
jgi:glycosyltransferase involved in cell wall biosynthesis